MPEPLFRPEALDAPQSRWLGGIVVGQPLSSWVLTCATVLAALAIVLFLVLGEYTRRTRVTGQLVPNRGMAAVTSPAPGTIVDVRVEEGAQVRAGDVLAVVAVPGSTLAGGDTTQALQAAIARRRDGVEDGYSSQRQQLEAQQAGLAEQIGETRAELAQLALEAETGKQQLALAQQALDRFRTLREQRFVTELQVQQQEAAVLEIQGDVQSLARQGAALRRLLRQLEQSQRELPARLAALDADARRDDASLAQEQVETSARGEAVILAPVDGTVGTLVGLPGQAVTVGQPVLSLLPQGSELEAHLLVPSRAIGFVAPGDAVLLRYQAFPYQKFGHYRGRVLRVTRSALSPDELDTLVGDAAPAEPFYRIVVALDLPTVRAYGRDEPLRAGMRLEADVLGERRQLWEWLVEPLYSLSGTFP
jgi:membrane fusion protein